jgi:hypothetical protein
LPSLLFQGSIRVTITMTQSFRPSTAPTRVILGGTPLAIAEITPKTATPVAAAK